MKRSITLSLDEQLIEEIKKLAGAKNNSVSQYVSDLIVGAVRAEGVVWPPPKPPRVYGKQGRPAPKAPPLPMPKPVKPPKETKTKVDQPAEA